MKTAEEKEFDDKIDQVELEELMYDEFYELIAEAIKIGKANGHEEAMRWRDPEVELPEFNKKDYFNGDYKKYLSRVKDMKTEPTEAMRERIKKLFEITAEEVAAIEANARRNEIIALAAFKKGQSSPKIKQLEWMENNNDHDIMAATPFTHYRLECWSAGIFLIIKDEYEIRQFETIDEAKAAAQAHFEKRVMECLDL